MELQEGALVVGGTTGNDVIFIGRSGSAGDTVTVSINGVDQGTFAPVSGIVAFGQAGADDIEVAGGVSLPAELYGGAGNDTLKGGAGPNILMGEEGSDELTGGTGRDVLVGGVGADHLVGSAGEDILIAGDFMLGSRFGERRQALLAVRQGWTTSDAYAGRVAALRAFLAARVADDGAADQLVGASDLDWYFASLTRAAPDKISGRHPEEIVYDLGGL